uniref:Uncharacterized protein n=1 Tax=viral metagenome TaxID=1070528 RepID=A0A6H1ZY50_9ZZZZ
MSTDTEVTRLEDPFLWKATPGKEKDWAIPMQRLSLTLNMKLLEKFNLLTDEEKRECLRYLKIMDKLIEGKVLK